MNEWKYIDWWCKNEKNVKKFAYVFLNCVLNLSSPASFVGQESETFIYFV